MDEGRFGGELVRTAWLGRFASLVVSFGWHMTDSTRGEPLYFESYILSSRIQGWMSPTKASEERSLGRIHSEARGN